jgi:uncharacterized membrane protein YeaQ/YmgE (transglycosylase-associated protein family)
MILAQIVVWTVVGGLTGFLAGLVMPQIKLGLLEALVAGILGAFAGGWVLGILGMFPEAGMIGTVLSGFLGAVVFLAFFVGVIARWRWSRTLQQHQNWSYVQPFEE